jgi:hypothetical protein
VLLAVLAVMVTEVQRYTAEADRKLLADRGMAKKRSG